MNKRKARLVACTVAAFVLLGAATYAHAAANAGGATAGAAAGSASGTASGSASGSAHPAGHRMAKGMGGFELLETASDVIGIDTEALRAELKAGKTLAQIAASKGIAKADLVAKLTEASAKKIDAKVADGKLTQAQADAIKAKLNERIDAAVESNRMSFTGKGHGHGRGHWAKLDEIAGLLGMTEDELKASLKEGKSLAEIAAAKGLSEDRLIAKLKENMTDELRDFVRAKRPAKPADAEGETSSATAAEG